jgi:protein TonB
LAQVRRHVEYPPRARTNGWQGKVGIFFRLGTDGQARDIRVAASSGIPLLDRSAVAAVRKSSPFTPPPRCEVALTLPVAYCLR